MARQAAVRLTLQNSQFLTEIKASGDAVDKVAMKGSRGFVVFGSAADTAKRSVMGVGAAVRNVLSLAGGLGGALSLVGGIKGAVQLERTYRQIAFGVKDAKGRMLETAEVQKIVERSAALAARSNAEMAQTFSDLLGATGDLDFTRDSMAAVGTTALATGKGLDVVANAADQMHVKFGFSATQMQDKLAQLFGAARQGGPSFEQLSETMSGVGADMLAAGLGGEKGFNFMLGSLVATDDAFKSVQKQATGLRATFRGLSEKGELTKLANKIGIDPKKLINEKDVLERVRMIFGKGAAGVKGLLDPLHEGEEKQTMKLLFTDPFQKALESANASGLKGRAAIDAALVDYDNYIRNFGKATMTGAEMLKRAEAERRAPEAQLTAALNRITTAFDRPEIITAITDLASHLPKLAEIVAEVIGFAGKHPIAAGAAGIGLKVGGDILTEAAGGALASGGGALVKRLLGKRGGGAIAKGVGGAIEGVAGAGAEGVAASGITRWMQMGLGGGITGEMLGAGGGALTSAELGAAGLPAVGALGAVGLTAGAIGLGALPGVALGYGLNKSYNNDDAVMKELANATIGASGGGSLDNRQAALARLDAARKAAKERNIGGGMFDALFRGLTGVDNQGLATEQMGDADAARAQLVKRIANMKGGQHGPRGEGSSVRMPEITIEGKPRPVSLDDKASRMIAEATRSALGGTVLTVRIASGPTGIPVTSGRAPIRPGETRQGGGV